MKNLLEKSDIYYKHSDIYETFAQAEDKPGLITDAVIPLIKGKDIADVGCGTGKYAALFAPHAKSVFAFDAAAAQLQTARNKTRGFSNVTTATGDAAEIAFPHRFDVIFSSWMLSTVTDAGKREKILSRLCRQLTPGGRIILVENAPDSEFEELRGRINDPLRRTETYNQWLLDNGFREDRTLDTFFEFENLDAARFIFDRIWGAQAAQQLKHQVVRHAVTLFILDF